MSKHCESSHIILSHLYPGYNKFTIEAFGIQYTGSREACAKILEAAAGDFIRLSEVGQERKENE